MEDTLIAVGRIVRPQGRRGEVRLEALTDVPERLRELTECYLVPPPAGERRAVEAVWFQGEVPIVKLGGSEDIEAADALVGRLVSIPRGSVRPLPPDRFYAFDLVGCRVETVDGAVEGRVAFEPRGGGGFGYDPIFFLPERGKTTAELTLLEKNVISHRALAVAKAVALLRRTGRPRGTAPTVTDAAPRLPRA